MLSKSIFCSRRSYSSAGARTISSLHEVVLLSGARTPVGKFNGALKTVSAVDLGITAVKAAVTRAGIKAEHVEEVYMGQVLQAGAGQAPARQVALGSGMPTTTEATTINKVCSSGLKAVILAAQSIQLGQRSLMVAGGMESMSRSPFYFPRNAAFGHQTASDAIVKDGLWDVYNDFHMGMCAEHCAEKHNISREAQDAFAIESYRRADEAWKAGRFDAEIASVTLSGKKATVVRVDEEYTGLKVDKVPTLRPAFKKTGGTVTAANASSLNDGASALVLAHKDRAAELGVKPMAEIVVYAEAALDPVDFTIAPTSAIKIALDRAGLKVGDIAKWELNEAFAVVGIANTQLLGLDAGKVNVNGGAVALGHPIGSSGSRILVSLLHDLKPGELGCAAICNGGGAASAIIIKSPRDNGMDVAVAAALDRRDGDAIQEILGAHSDDSDWICKTLQSLTTSYAANDSLWLTPTINSLARLLVRSSSTSVENEASVRVLFRLFNLILSDRDPNNDQRYETVTITGIANGRNTNGSGTQSGTQSKRSLVFKIANHLFTLYFRLGQIRLCHTIIANIISSRVPLSSYGMSDRVTFRYHVGRYHLSQQQSRRARSHLKWAFENCTNASPRNKRIILIHLVAASLPLGIFAMPDMLRFYAIDTYFIPLMMALQKGDWRSYHACIKRHETWYVARGIWYLLGTRCDLILYRSAIRRAFLSLGVRVEQKVPHVTLCAVLATVVYITRGDGREEDEDDEEWDLMQAEMLCVSLIDAGYIQAYINRDRGVLVLKRDERFGFPLVSSLFAGASDQDDDDRWD